MHVFLCIIFRAINLYPEKSRGGSRMSDVMAFLIVAGLSVTYLGIAGVLAYTTDVVDLKAMEADPFYRGEEFVTNHLIIPMVMYQTWNFFACLLVAEFNDIFMIGHHFVTGSLGYFGFYPYLHYKGLFFFGVAELTNIPLTIYDVFKRFKDLKQKFPALDNFVQMIFAASFIIVRLVAWPIISFDFWIGSIKLLMSGEAHSNFVVCYFLVSNIFLTGLQLMWGQTIIGKLLEALGLSKKKDRKKEI